MKLQSFLILAALAVCLGRDVRAQTPAKFLEPLSFGNGLAQAIVTGDFNGDGALDTVTIGSDLSVYLGNGHGSFTVQPPIGISGTSIAAADFNGDGNLDLAVAGGDAVLILLGNGDGTFRAPVSYSTLATVIALGDFNGDGVLDVAAFGQPLGNADAQVQIFFGSSNGTFEPGPVNTSLPSGIPLAIAAADFNRDGKLDLAVAYSTYHELGEMAVLFGNGDGTFAAPSLYPDNLASYIYALVTADFNGDGAPDLAYAANDAQVAVLLNNGTGQFTAAAPIQLRDTAISLAAADLNRDGKIDLFAAGSGIGAVLLGNGDGTFQGFAQYVLAYEGTALAIADFNGDGIPDVAATNGTNSYAAPPLQPPLVVMLGAGHGSFQSSRAFDASAAPNGIALGDFNRDGNLDVAVSNYSYSVPGASSISIQLGDGKGDLAAPVNYPAPKPTAIAVSDVNRDGNPDVIFVGQNCVGTLPGKGDGTFGPSIFSSCPGCGNVLLVADFNHDGNPDVATAASGQGVIVLLGKGDGSFRAPVPYGPANQPTSLAAADFRNNGRLDLVASVSGSFGGTYLLMSNGDGTFAAPVLLNGAGTSAVTGDYNGDGNADIAMTLYDGNGVAVYLGHGDGTFTPAYTVSAPVGAPLLAGDFNGDGILDLLGPAGSDLYNMYGLSTILLGKGNGDFVVQKQQYLMDAANYLYAAAGDFNGDGKLDVATTAFDGSVWIVLNTTR